VHIEEEEVTPQEAEAQKRRATLYDVLEAAAQFYEAQLWARAEGQSARDYLEGRGMGTAASRTARLGLAPPGWTRLSDALSAKFDPALLTEAGLVRVAEGGRAYDVQRDRLVFPITDDRGRVIAFGGRLMQGEGPKYLNTPETRLYVKSRTLYGLGSARAAIQRKDRVIVVEGYFDALALHQAGFEEAVATCGTAMTAEHVERIRRLTRNVVLALDADEAGQRAAERSLQLFVDAGLQPSRLEIPGQKDPDEFVRKAGAEGVESALARKEPLLEWVVARRLDALGTGAMAREAVLAELAPWLARYDDSALVSRISQRLGIHETVIRRKVATARPRQEPSSADTAAAPAWRADRDTVHLLWLLVHRRAEVADLMQRVLPHLFRDGDPTREAATRLLAGEPVAGLVGSEFDPEVARTLAAIVAREDLYDPDTAALAVCQIAARMASPARAAALARLTARGAEALKAGDSATFRALALTRERFASQQKRLDDALARGDYGLASDLLVESFEGSLD
jgi:DNA primase